VPVEGEMIKWEWFRIYDDLPPSESGDRIIQSWDTPPRPANSMITRSALPGW